jgi:hypothetical protein
MAFSQITYTTRLKKCKLRTNGVPLVDPSDRKPGLHSDLPASAWPPTAGVTELRNLGASSFCLMYVYLELSSHLGT